jgi:hypothetical protein
MSAAEERRLARGPAKRTFATDGKTSRLRSRRRRPGVSRGAMHMTHSNAQSASIDARSALTVPAAIVESVRLSRTLIAASPFERNIFAFVPLCGATVGKYPCICTIGCYKKLMSVENKQQRPA